MDDENPSERALEIARAIRKEYEVGKSSKFCDESDFDFASEGDLARLIEKALKTYESSPEWARERLRKIEARMKGAPVPPPGPPARPADPITLFKRTDKQNVSILHCDCGETYTWAGVDPSLDAWIMTHLPHLKFQSASPSAKTARFDRSAVAPPCNCDAVPGQHVHTPAGTMNYRAAPPKDNS